MANIFSFLFSNIVFTFINRKVQLSEFSRHFLNFQLHCSGMGHRTYPGDVLFGSFENKDVCSRPYLLRVLQAELRGCFFTTPCSCTSCPFCLLSYYRQTGNKVNLQYKNLFTFLVKAKYLEGQDNQVILLLLLFSYGLPAIYIPRRNLKGTCIEASTSS